MMRPMSRSLWFVAGAGAGAYAITRVKRVAEAFTPEGLADRMAGWSLGAHLFGEEVRAGMAEKETELRERMGMGLHGLDELGHRRPIDHPNRIGKGND